MPHCAHSQGNEGAAFSTPVPPPNSGNCSHPSPADGRRSEIRGVCSLPLPPAGPPAPGVAGCPSEWCLAPRPRGVQRPRVNPADVRNTQKARGPGNLLPPAGLRFDLQGARPGEAPPRPPGYAPPPPGLGSMATLLPPQV